MFVANELDKKNTYNPNLKDINESIERTYEEANIFFEMVDGYLKKIENKIYELSQKQVYDICNAVASDLAKCSELYLKSIYIFENNVDGNSIDSIWKELKNSIYQVDTNGNLIYLLENSEGIKYTYQKVDKNGKKVTDDCGNNIYIDEHGNEYCEGKQGKKIKLNGHQLDRLISSLSEETRRLLEMRMLIIPMSNTKMYNEISVYDELKKNGIIYSKYHMLESDYNNWIEQHKKTYEQTRYAGQNKYNINVEFLYHLTTQIKAVAQYKLRPNKKQIINKKNFIGELNSIWNLFDIFEKDIWKDNYSNKELKYFDNYDSFCLEISTLPVKIQELLMSVNYNLISFNLITLVKTDKSVYQKLNYINDILKNCYFLNDLDSVTLYNLLSSCDDNEISCILFICKQMTNDRNPYSLKNDVLSRTYIETKNIADSFHYLNFTKNDVINYAIHIKKKYNCKINNNIFLNFVDFINFVKVCYEKIDDEIVENVNKKLNF